MQVVCIPWVSVSNVLLMESPLKICSPQMYISVCNYPPLWSHSNVFNTAMSVPVHPPLWSHSIVLNTAMSVPVHPPLWSHSIVLNTAMSVPVHPPLWSHSIVLNTAMSVPVHSVAEVAVPVARCDHLSWTASWSPPSGPLFPEPGGGQAGWVAAAHEHLPCAHHHTLHPRNMEETPL